MEKNKGKKTNDRHNNRTARRQRGDQRVEQPQSDMSVLSFMMQKFPKVGENDKNLIEHVNKQLKNRAQQRI